MIKWAQFPFLRIILAFITGILAAVYWPEASQYGILLFLASVIIYGALYLLARKRKSAFAASITGLLGLGCFGLAGFALTYIRTASNNPQHLLNQTGEVTHYQGYINDFLLEKPTVFQTTLKLQKVKMNGKWQPAGGKIQVSFRKTKNDKVIGFGDVLLVKGAPKVVPAPLNPGQFNYRNFLANQQIYHQHFINAGQFEITGRQIDNPVKALSIQLRQNLDQIFKHSISGKREYGIASALVLGVKDQLDNDVKAAYTNTGTMHVLAVSGLHVGLVFFLLNLVLKRFQTTAAQRLFSAALILSFIWAYAFITALSPSVLRAAVMFTLVVVAQVMVRKTNIYNTLAVAAFMLLCVNPFYLLEVGFQLSFMAVLAIVYLQPKLVKLYTPETWLGGKVWSLLCISLAAQIGTFPFSLYYFHQFPVYFLLSNLIAVPLATAILYAGFAVLFLSWVPVLGKVAGWAMEKMLWLMNESMLLVEKLPLAVIDRIPVTMGQTLIICLFMLLVLVFLTRPNLKVMIAACLGVLLFSGSKVNESLAISGQERFMVLAVPRQSVYGFFRNDEAAIIADSAFIQNKRAIKFNLEPIYQQALTQSISYQTWQDPSEISVPVKNYPEGQLVVWQGLRIFALEKPLNRNLATPLALEVLVLRNNVYITPEKLLANFQPKKIVFDSSNDGWYVRWLGKKLTGQNIYFHDVQAQGAFVWQK